jgi:TM2 domain-containing membrane protein YozV
VFGCSAAPVEEATIRVDPSELANHGYSGFPDPRGASRHEASTNWLSSYESTSVPPPPLPGLGNVAAEESGNADPNVGSFPLSPISSHASVERRLYVVLAVACGFLGAHNLYANRTSTGIIQLCATTLTCFLALPVTWIWALIEAATIDHDGDGMPMV